MATVPTNNPIPSEDPRDLKFNAGKIDEVVTSDAHYYTDRFGVRRWTIAGFQYTAEEAIRNYGYITMDSFEDGATLTLPNQVLRYESTGEYYRWDGEFPKTVPSGSTPETAGGVGLGAWVSVGDASLRSDLSKETGGELVGLKKNGLISNSSTTIADFYQTTVINLTTDYGLIGDFDPTLGVSNGTNNTAAFQLAIDAVIANGGNATLRFPSGKFRFKKIDSTKPGGVAVALGLEGAGLKNVIIEGSGFSTELYCDDIGRLFGLYAADNVVIRNMKVIGYGGGPTAATRERDQGFALGYNCKNVTFDNVYIDNFYGDCI